VAQQETLTLIRARDALVRLRTGAVNSVRGLAKPCGYRLGKLHNRILIHEIHDAETLLGVAVKEYDAPSFHALEGHVNHLE
jgi:hypothetical protein